MRTYSSKCAPGAERRARRRLPSLVPRVRPPRPRRGARGLALPRFFPVSNEGIRPPRREPYARARGLSAEEVARLLAAIPVESAAGLRLRALVLAYLLTGRRRSEVLNLRWRDLDLEGGFYRYTGSGHSRRRPAWRLLPGGRSCGALGVCPPTSPRGPGARVHVMYRRADPSSHQAGLPAGLPAGRPVGRAPDRRSN
jgi:integrase